MPEPGCRSLSTGSIFIPFKAERPATPEWPRSFFVSLPAEPGVADNEWTSQLDCVPKIYYIALLTAAPLRSRQAGGAVRPFFRLNQKQTGWLWCSEYLGHTIDPVRQLTPVGPCGITWAIGATPPAMQIQGRWRLNSSFSEVIPCLFLQR